MQEDYKEALEAVAEFLGVDPDSVEQELEVMTQEQEDE